MEYIYDFEDYNEITEGESILKQYFIEKGFGSEFQKRITNLKGDSKGYRVADFYLPNLKIYVEFFGMWNVSDKKKEDYREKKRIYKENNIPCVYIYPENLGVIEYIFPYRVRGVLEYFNMNKQLRRLFINNFWSRHISIILTVIAIFGGWIGYIFIYPSIASMLLALSIIYLLWAMYVFIFFIVVYVRSYRISRLVNHK